MNKRFLNILIVLLSLTLLVACGNEDVEEKEKVEVDPVEDVGEELEVNIASLKGPTTIGLANMLDKHENQVEGDISYNFQVLGMAEEVVSGLNKGEIDMAAIPANLAATLYNKTEGEIKVAAINTLGVLHMVENGLDIEEPKDLEGRTIYSVGKGTTPEGVLNLFIDKNELEDVTIEYKSEASEIAALLKTEEDIIAMIPEPFATVVETNNENVRRIFDMNEEWKKLNDGNSMVTGVLVVRDEFLEENPNVVDSFLEEYEKSIEVASSDASKIAGIVEELEIIPEGLGEKSIPNISMEYIDGKDMKDMLEEYLQDLFDFKAELVGGSMPGEDFYYKK